MTMEMEVQLKTVLQRCVQGADCQLCRHWPTTCCSTVSCSAAYSSMHAAAVPLQPRLSAPSTASAVI